MRDRKQNKYLLEGSDDAARVHLEEKEQAAAQHVEEPPVSIVERK
jgi:hypothetical protein